MSSLKATKLVSINELQPLTEEEVEWDLINESTSGQFVNHSLKDVYPRCECITGFVERFYQDIKPIKQIRPLADAESAPMWIYKFNRDGRTFRVARTMMCCEMTDKFVYDWEPQKLIFKFFIVGLPEIEGTTVQICQDDIEWTIPIFMADLCTAFAQGLENGEHLSRVIHH